MEQTESHVHRYSTHLEIAIAFIALVMLGFGIYEAVSGQTGGISPYDPNPQTYTPLLDPVSTGSGSTGGVVSPYNPNPGTYNTGVVVTGGTGFIGPLPADPTRNYVGTYADPGNLYYVNNTTGGTTTGGNGSTTAGGTTGGYSTGGYYVTGGAYYNQGGRVDSAAVRTQGGYVNPQGGYYGQGGFNEASAVKTEGIVKNTVIAPTTDQNLSVQHCQFITKYHKFGDRGGDVPKIQQFLKDRGYYAGKVDGVYGYATFKAVQAFQKDYGDRILSPWDISTQKPTGITNISTKYAINKIVGCPDPATIIPTTGKILNY